MPLCQTSSGLTFECLDEAEAEYLYQEIFVRESYLRAADGEVVISIQPGDTVVDVGANIGLFTFFCLERRCAKVISIEPVPQVYSILERNVLMNTPPKSQTERDCVTTVNVAVGASQESESSIWYNPSCPGESTRHLGEWQSQQQIIEEEKLNGEGHDMNCERPSLEEMTCPVQTLPTILDDISDLEGTPKDFPIHLLKVDVEGDELNVLLGLSGMWQRIVQVVVEVRDVDHRLQSVVSLIESKAFQTRVVSQEGGLVGDYVMQIPKRLGYFYVFGFRNRS